MPNEDVSSKYYLPDFARSMTAKFKAFLLMAIIASVYNGFGVNLGERCKWVTRMYFYVLKGPIFHVKTANNDIKTVGKQRSSEKSYAGHDL